MNYSFTLYSNNNYVSCDAWIIAIMDEQSNFKFFNSITPFFYFMYTMDKAKIYMSNMKQKGSFIIDKLFKEGFNYNKNVKELENNEFTCLISGAGIWYNIVINIEGQKIEFIDIGNITRMDVYELRDKVKTYNDMKLINNVGSKQLYYEANELELEAVRNECYIVMDSINFFLERNMYGVTIGSVALRNYKTTINFKNTFPELTSFQDKEIRQSYRGGFNWLNPKYKGRDIGKGIVYDVNGLYQHIMDTELLPFGNPIFCDGEPETDENYKLWIGQVRFEFELKPDHIPTIQLKKGFTDLAIGQHLETSNGKCVVMTVTNVDWELITEQYDVYNVEWFGYYQFRASNVMFKTFCDMWSTRKEIATKNGDHLMRMISKMIPNNLSGKFATNPTMTRKIPFPGKSGIWFKTVKEDTEKTIYSAVSCFITAYARKIVVRAGQANYNRVIYFDTDSMHLEGLEPPEGIKLNNIKTGSWKTENVFEKGRYITTKCYLLARHISENHVSLKRVISGADKDIIKQINFKNFFPGNIFYGKRQHTIVDGGTILTRTTFTIPDD